MIGTGCLFVSFEQLAIKSRELRRSTQGFQTGCDRIGADSRVRMIAAEYPLALFEDLLKQGNAAPGSPAARRQIPRFRTQDSVRGCSRPNTLRAFATACRRSVSARVMSPG